MLSLVLFAALLQQPTTTVAPPSPPTVTAPAEDPAVTALAIKIYGQMRTGKVDEAYLTPDMNAALTPAVLAQSKPLLDQLGDIKTLTLQATQKSEKGTAYTYLATFPTAQFHIAIFLIPTGKIAGYRLTP